MKIISGRFLVLALGGAMGWARAAPPSLAAALQPFVDRGKIAGAVALVTSREKILEVETVGYSDVAAGKPISADDLFWIASMTKPITATAVMMLVDEGKVALEAPVENYLPEFKGQMLWEKKAGGGGELKKPGHPILVRELLSHVSGLPSVCPEDHWKGDELPLSVHVLVYARCRLENEPGTHFAYSSAGIAILGRIVEAVSGLPYEKFLATRLFEPLGMKDTTFFPSREQLARLARTYGAAKGGGLAESPIAFVTYPLDGPHRYPAPAGGLFSTAHDLANFCRMYLGRGVFQGKRYLSPESWAKMTVKETSPAVATKYGYGWRISLALADLERVSQGFGHGGAYHTYMFLDPKSDLAGVFLTQHNLDWGGDKKSGKAIWKDFVRASYAMVGVDVETAKLDLPEGSEP